MLSMVFTKIFRKFLHHIGVVIMLYFLEMAKSKKKNYHHFCHCDH